MLGVHEKVYKKHENECKFVRTHGQNCTVFRLRKHALYIHAHENSTRTSTDEIAVVYTYKSILVA